MEPLQMLKFSVKQGWELNFTSGTSKELEIMDLELFINEQVSVPEDINGFIQRLNQGGAGPGIPVPGSG